MAGPAASLATLLPRPLLAHCAQYFACLLLATALWAWGTESYFLSRAPGLANWLANLTVMPLSFYMYTGQDTFTLIPPAWSLGVELQFYLLAPAIVLAWRRLAVALAASLLVFIAAQCQLLNTDHYGYRLLPGVLFIFLLGACLSPHQPPAQRRVLRGAVLVLWLAGLAYLVWLFRNGPWLPFNREVIVGLVLGVPAVALLQRRRRRHPRREQAQRVLGALSYGVFLFHFPAMWLLGIAPAGDPADVVLVLAMSTLLAAIGHWGVERPLWKRFRPFDDPPADRPVRAGIG